VSAVDELLFVTYAGIDGTGFIMFDETETETEF
jgi:hypothetical protein